MKRNGFQVMSRLIGLVKPLTGYMFLAISMGLMGHLAASWTLYWEGLQYWKFCIPKSSGLGVIFVAVLVLAFVRGFLRYAEQACNHFIALSCWL